MSGKAGFINASLIGLILAGILFLVVRRRLRLNAHSMINSKEGVNKLFTIPLIFAAALLSFAHGSNDVANAIGPLAAIVDDTPIIRAPSQEMPQFLYG